MFAKPAIGTVLYDRRNAHFGTVVAHIEQSETAVRIAWHKWEWTSIIRDRDMCEIAFWNMALEDMIVECADGSKIARYRDTAIAYEQQLQASGH